MTPVSLIQEAESQDHPVVQIGRVSSVSTVSKKGSPRVIIYFFGGDRMYPT